MTRKSSKTKTVSLGWCIDWPDGILRTVFTELPPFSAKFLRVRITVEQVFDKRGRAIERVVK